MVEFTIARYIQNYHQGNTHTHTHTHDFSKGNKVIYVGFSTNNNIYREVFPILKANSRRERKLLHKRFKIQDMA